MRIGHLSPGSLPLPPAPCTSVEIYASRLAAALSARRHPVTLYAKGATSREHTRARLTIKRVITAGGLAYVRRLLPHLKQLNPDIIQIENRIPFVPLLRHHFPGNSLVLNLHSNVLIASQPRSLVQQTLRQIDALVVNSSFLKRDLLRKYPTLRAAKVHVIHPGISTAHFPSRFSPAGQRLRERTRTRMGIAPSRQVLLFVGRLIPRKGIGVLLDAFRQLRQTNRQAELWIVGGRPTGNSAFHRTLRAKATGLPVRFLGFVRQHRLPPLYCAADLFVCPSQQPEAFGLVNLEAAASGLPVVASNNWGIREAVQQGVTGHLVKEYKRPAAFTAVFRQLLADPERLTQLGRSARRHVEEHHSWERAAAQFETLYRSLQRTR